MIGTMEIQLQRITMQFLTLTRSQISSLLHLSKYDISSILTTIWESYRIKQRRILTQANKRCRLKNRQILRFLIKICLSSCFYTNSSMQEVEIVIAITHSIGFWNKRSAVDFTGCEYNCLANCCVIVLPPPALV